MAAVHCVVSEPMHSVHVSTEVSDEKSLQQNPALMNVEYPAAQVAVVHSLVSGPLHSEQVSTETTVAKSLQQKPESMKL